MILGFCNYFNQIQIFQTLVISQTYPNAIDFQINCSRNNFSNPVQFHVIYSLLLFIVFIHYYNIHNSINLILERAQ